MLKKEGSFRYNNLSLKALSIAAASAIGLYAISGELFRKSPAGSDKYTPIEMPASASALPWPNATVQPFLMPINNIKEANCGRVLTYKGKEQTGSHQIASRTDTVAEFESDYEKATGRHDPKLKLLLTTAGDVHRDVVILCVSQAAVHYARP